MPQERKLWNRDFDKSVFASALERRKYFRAEITYPIRLTYRLVSNSLNNDNSGLREGFFENISAGGMFLRASGMNKKNINDLFPGKSMVDVEVDTPNHENKARLLGKIMWIDKPKDPEDKGCGLGIQFEKIDKEDQERLFSHAVESIFK